MLYLSSTFLTSFDGGFRSDEVTRQAADVAGRGGNHAARQKPWPRKANTLS